MEKVQIYRHNSIGKFQAREELPGHKGLVRDVSWAVSMGRSYHLIATASKDGHVRIFRLTAPFGSMFAPRPKARQGNGVDHHNGGAGLSQGLGASDMMSTTEDQAEDEGEGWKVELEADFSDHRTEVWKVAWNATGTILSSTGDDGKIRLWKQNLRGEFVLMSVINTPRGR
jgi:nucleoporin SEH1